MLSICIPTYNYLVIKLVSELHKQCQNNNIDYEILILEDGSSNSFFSENAENLSRFKNVKHILFTENQGRSKTRNYLANLAQFDNLLFLDSDSEISDENFINCYLNNIENSVICGGTIYLKSQKEKNKELRYKYGIISEMLSVDTRTKNKIFTTNNFLIHKKIFEQIQFKEFLTKYGHEDSLFGYELRKNNINIKHINNPVIHAGIEENAVFLDKTRLAIDNLIILNNQTTIDPNFINDITLAKTYKKVKNLKLHYLLKGLFKIFKNIILKHLLNSKNPNIFVFNFYKLGYYTIMQ